MSHRVTRRAAPRILAAFAPFPVRATTSCTHLVHCGTCRRWLHVDEDELLASLDGPLFCWSCSGNERT